MYRIISIALAALFAALCSASNSTPPFEVKGTKIHKVAGGNVTLEFTVHDPAPLGKATQYCRASWKTGSRGFPQGPYQPCGNSTFSWTMESYDTIASFVISIEHSYKDPAIGDPPYDWISNYGSAQIKAPAMKCMYSTHGHAKCIQNDSHAIKAPITETSAKRK